MSVHHAWVGAPTPTSMRLSTRTSGIASLRWTVSAAPDLTAPVYSAPVVPDAEGLAKHVITGLTPGAPYYYGLEADGTLLTDPLSRGRFTTAPPDGAEAPIRFWFAGDRRTDSDHPVYEAILARDPMFGLFLGDLGYNDPQTEEVTRYLWRTSLAQPRFSRLVRECPTFYTYDQHDFGGNGSWSGSPNAATAHRYARDYPATYPLPATGLYCTWRIGRCRFVQLDTRTLRSDPSLPDGSDKSVLGAAQKQWFKDLLAASTEPLIFVLLSFPHRPGAPDRWGSYATEFADLNAYIAGIPGLAGRTVWLSADMHTLAADDGSHSPNGSVQLVGAALDQTGFQGTGGLYFNPESWSHGWVPNPEGTGQYGWVEVIDEGSSITLTFTGYDHTGTARITLTKTFGDLLPGPLPGSATKVRQNDEWSVAHPQVYTNGQWRPSRRRDRHTAQWH